MIKHSKGVTLLEILLVLAIAASIIVLGIQQYASYQSYRDGEALKYNVDVLFQAATNFYRANCRQTKDASGSIIKPGVLDPDALRPSPTRYPLDIVIDLSTPGYLSKWPLPPNPLIDSGDNNYVVQFNLTTADRTQMIDGTSTKVGTIYLWKVQVAAKLNSNAATNAKTYQRLLSANCLSSLSGILVTPCTADSTGDYLVWERLPSMSSPEGTTELWPTMPIVNQFNQMYTTYPLNSKNEQQYGQKFLCNG